jgi:hypothetical protein
MGAAGMKVLVACEFSGTVRAAFAKRGHTAVSCDILPSEEPWHGFNPWHYQGDIVDVLDGRCPPFWDLLNYVKWDLLIAHPPCTYLTNAGVRWLYKGGRGKVIDEARWAKMIEARDFFDKLWGVPIGRVCIENPIPHRHAELPPYTQTVQPWQFGHGETKATCLWLRNLPPLIPTNIVEGREPKVHHMSPGPNRWKERSRTYRGIADAMADQWGSL